MKKAFLVSLIAAFLYPNFVFASKNIANKEESSVEIEKDSPKFEAYKDVLYKLVKQDELLDEALEKSKNAKMDDAYLDYLSGISILVKKNLNEAAAVNKTQLAYVSSDAQSAKYARTIMSYSNKIDRKVRALCANVEKLSFPAYKNAPVSAKKSVKGKKLSQLLKEQEKTDALKKNLASLKKASQRAKATGKWLYVACK